jgi:ligand-binding sensor domain-containing protein
LLKDQYRYKLVWLLVFSLIFTDLTAQPDHFSLKKYTAKDGLPDSYILSICPDSRGFLWIGTINGISRFDGKNFINYNLSDGLVSLSARLIYEDSIHTLWGATDRGMMALKGNRFYTYPLSDSAKLNYAGISYTKSMGIIATTSNGIYHFEKDHWQKIKCYPGLENNNCHQVLETKEGIYFNYGGLLIRQRNNSYELLGEKKGRSGPYFRGINSFNDTTYLATEDGIFKIDGYRQIPIFEHPLHNKIIYAFYKDTKNRYWVCTDKDGLLISEPGNTKEFKWHIPVAQNLVSGFFEDKTGNLWLACADGLGLINEKDISRFTHNISGVYSILETPDKKAILAYCRQNRLLLFTGNDFKNSAVKLPLNKEDLVDYSCFDDKGRLWFSTRYQKLLCQDKMNIKDYSFLSGHSVNILGVDFNLKKRRLSIAADTFKVGDEKSQENFISSNNRKFILHPYINHSFFNGMQIVSTRFDGSFLIDMNDNAVTVNEALGISKTIYGYTFLEEPGGKFWIYNNGTGISRYHWNAHNLPEKDMDITPANGLPSNIVNSACIDKYHRLWVVTPSGLLLIKPDSSGNNQPSIFNIGNKLEINSDDPENTKLLTGSDGYAWISKPSEIFRFNPDSILLKQVTPSISIESIRILSSSVKLLDKFNNLLHFWAEPDEVSLLYDENSLQIDFNGISFENYPGLKYSYKLQGLDSNWSQPDRNTSISFIKLSPGNYTFYVKAKTTANNWSTPASFSFIIKTPFWETWWFRMLIIILSASVIVSIFQYRIKQIRTRAELKTQLQELESRALKAQMNPHFIFNAMNSIQSLILHNRTDEAGNYISKFAKLMRHVLENADANLVSIEKELNSIQLYIELEKLRMNVDLDYTEDIDPELAIQQEKIPSLILQPFVENALWHGLSKKEGDKKLSIKIKGDKNWIICEIKDNGVGRENAAGHYDQLPEGHLSRATGITLQRLISYNNSPSTQPIEIIDQKDNHGNPVGTTVVIRIKREGYYA